MKSIFCRIIYSIILLASFNAIGEATIFTAGPDISLPAAQTAIASADLNEDGTPDSIIGGEPVAGEEGTIRVLLGNGDGSFRTPAIYQVGYNPGSLYSSPHVEAIKVIDLDADGHLDVVVAHNGERDFINRSTVHATVLFGEGDGRLIPADGYAFAPQFNSIVVSSIDFGDFDNDGKTDIVIGAKFGSGLGTAFFLGNNGNRTFERHAFPVVGANIYEIAAIYFDNDAFVDLIMTTNEGIFIIYGRGDYFDNTSRNEQRDAGLFEFGLTVGDFNADGRTDFAAVEILDKRLRVHLNGGSAASPVVYETDISSAILSSADVNGDGKLDLLISDSRIGDFQTFYGTGSGTFGDPEITRVNLPVSDVALADFDGNGKTDIAFSLYRDPPGSQAGILLNAPRRQGAIADFDGDGKSDISVFRPSNGTWYLNRSTAGFAGLSFGIASDKTVPADYDGDGRTDLAVYRAGVWYLQRSQLGFAGISFGTSEDIPAPADYDGDGRADLAVFRPSNGTWYLLQSTSGFVGRQFGQTGDKPVAADYDGDGKADLAIFRNGNWYIQRSRLGFTGISFGAAEDRLVPADYDGDGKTDVAVFRPGNGTWYLLQTQAGFTGIQFGANGDVPTAADYDGDGKSDIGVFRNGIWYLQRSSQGFAGIQFGGTTDQPIPNAFVR